MIETKDWEVVLRNPALLFYISVFSLIFILTLIIGFSYNPFLCYFGIILVGTYLIFYYSVYKNLKKKKYKKQ
jgi:hypothetical protein